MKIQEHLNDIKKSFHLRHGFEFGFSESQSEAHFDITTQASLQYLQGLLMSGKLSEIQDLIKENPDALKHSSYYNDLIKACADSYYALDWEAERKEHLAQVVLAFAIQGLREKFQAGGYASNASGVLQFLGMDTGLAGMMGKVGGFFGKFKK